MHVGIWHTHTHLHAFTCNHMHINMYESHFGSSKTQKTRKARSVAQPDVKNTCDNVPGPRHCNCQGRDGRRICAESSESCHGGTTGDESQGRSEVQLTVLRNACTSADEEPGYRCHAEQGTMQDRRWLPLQMKLSTEHPMDGLPHRKAGFRSNTVQSSPPSPSQGSSWSATQAWWARLLTRPWPPSGRHLPDTPTPMWSCPRWQPTLSGQWWAVSNIWCQSQLDGTQWSWNGMLCMPQGLRPATLQPALRLMQQCLGSRQAGHLQTTTTQRCLPGTSGRRAWRATWEGLPATSETSSATCVGHAPATKAPDGHRWTPPSWCRQGRTSRRLACTAQAWGCYQSKSLVPVAMTNPYPLLINGPPLIIKFEILGAHSFY